MEDKIDKLTQTINEYKIKYESEEIQNNPKEKLNMSLELSKMLIERRKLVDNLFKNTQLKQEKQENAIIKIMKYCGRVISCIST